MISVLFVLGFPGSGKSTLSDFLAVELLRRKKGSSAIRIEMSDLVRQFMKEETQKQIAAETGETTAPIEILDKALAAKSLLSTQKGSIRLYDLLWDEIEEKADEGIDFIVVSGVRERFLLEVPTKLRFLRALHIGVLASEEIRKGRYLAKGHTAEYFEETEQRTRDLGIGQHLTDLLTEKDTSTIFIRNEIPEIDLTLNSLIEKVAEKLNLKETVA